MNTYSFLILIFFFTPAIASPLQPVEFASLSDFTDFQQLDPVSKSVETDLMPSISTTEETTTGPSITDSWLGAVQFQPSSPSNLDTAGSLFELAEKPPTAKLGPPAPTTGETVYLCCESKGENVFECEDHQR